MAMVHSCTTKLLACLGVKLVIYSFSFEPVIICKSGTKSLPFVCLLSHHCTELPLVLTPALCLGTSPGTEWMGPKSRALLWSEYMHLARSLLQNWVSERPPGAGAKGHPGLF